MFVWHWMELESDIVEALAAALWWLHLQWIAIEDES